MVANIFGQVIAGKMKMKWQNLAASLGRQAASITSKIGRLEKQANSQKRAAQQVVRQQQSVFSQQNLMSSAITALKSDDACKAFFKEDGSFDMNNQAAYMKVNDYVSQQRLQASTWAEAQMTEIEQQYEDFVNMMIEPLNDDQADLQAQKEVADNQAKMYEGMEQQQQKYADSNIKNMFNA